VLTRNSHPQDSGARFLVGCGLLASVAYSLIPYSGPAFAEETPPREKEATVLTMQFTPNRRLQHLEKELENGLEKDVAKLRAGK